MRLREEKIVPYECDLNLVNQLFKTGNAAMVINGPWSWGGYLDAGIDIGVTRIPIISETGLWPTPMVAATGYCLNVNVTGERRERTAARSETITSRMIGAAKSSTVVHRPGHRGEVTNSQLAALGTNFIATPFMQ